MVSFCFYSSQLWACLIMPQVRVKPLVLHKSVQGCVKVCSTHQLDSPRLTQRPDIFLNLVVILMLNLTLTPISIWKVVLYYPRGEQNVKRGITTGWLQFANWAHVSSVWFSLQLLKRLPSNDGESDFTFLLWYAESISTRTFLAIISYHSKTCVSRRWWCAVWGRCDQSSKSSHPIMAEFSWYRCK